jgi:hypothetical protein
MRLAGGVSWGRCFRMQAVGVRLAVQGGGSGWRCFVRWGSGGRCFGMPPVKVRWEVHRVVGCWVRRTVHWAVGVLREVHQDARGGVLVGGASGWALQESEGRFFGMQAVGVRQAVHLKAEVRLKKRRAVVGQAGSLWEGCPWWRSGGRCIGLWAAGSGKGCIGRWGFGGRCIRICRWGVWWEVLPDAGGRWEVPQDARGRGLGGGASGCVAGVMGEVLPDAGCGSQASSATGRWGSGCRCVMRWGSGGRWSGCRQRGSGWRCVE